MRRTSGWLKRTKAMADHGDSEDIENEIFLDELKLDDPDEHWRITEGPRSTLKVTVSILSDDEDLVEETSGVWLMMPHAPSDLKRRLRDEVQAFASRLHDLAEVRRLVDRDLRRSGRPLR